MGSSFPVDLSGFVVLKTAGCPWTFQNCRTRCLSDIGSRGGLFVDLFLDCRTRGWSDGGLSGCLFVDLFPDCRAQGWSRGCGGCPRGDDLPRCGPFRVSQIVDPVDAGVVREGMTFHVVDLSGVSPIEDPHFCGPFPLPRRIFRIAIFCEKSEEYS